MPRRNGISEKEISDYWGIELAEPFEVIPALTNAVVRCGAYVIRSERRPIESVAWEHDLLSFLSAGVPEVVAPIHAKDGGTFLAQRGDVVSVFPYVHAEHMKRNDEEVHVQLPLNLGRIHRRATAWPKTRQRPGQPSFRELDFEKNLWWDRSIIPRTPVLEDAFDRTRACVGAAPATLTTSAIHGDLNPGNVLTREGKVAAVLDWSFARLDWPAFDLACPATRSRADRSLG